MNFKRLEEFFSLQNEENITVRFDTIEEACGRISDSYINLKHLHLPAYAFAQHALSGGYILTGADYDHRLLFARKSRATSDDTSSAPVALTDGGERTQSLDERALDSYTMLVSKEMQRRTVRGLATEEEILRYVISSGGFIAATSGFEHFQSDSVVMREKNGIVDLAIEKIHLLRGGEVNFDSWLYNSCRDTRYGMRFGLWQKVLNISLKYMYLFNQIHGLFNEYARAWQYCHCPVDKIIRDIVVKMATNSNLEVDMDRLGGIVWNFISEEDYAFFQNVISRLCTEKNIGSKMFFDVIYWKRPSRNR